MPGTNPSYLSTYGAFNGSGLATAATQGASGDLNVYFQHFSGELRRMQLTDSNNWVGGDENSIVATDAKNATPISIVAYSVASVATVGSTMHQWSVFDENSGICFISIGRIMFVRK